MAPWSGLLVARRGVLVWSCPPVFWSASSSGRVLGFGRVVRASVGLCVVVFVVAWWLGRVVVFELVLASSGASYYLQRAAGKSAAVRQLAVWLFGRCLEGLCQSGSRY